jgi:hypothetical protein
VFPAALAQRVQTGALAQFRAKLAQGTMALTTDFVCRFLISLPIILNFGGWHL